MIRLLALLTLLSLSACADEVFFVPTDLVATDAGVGDLAGAPDQSTSD